MDLKKKLSQSKVSLELKSLDLKLEEKEKKGLKITANPRYTIVAPPGRVLVSIDFKAQEIYIAAVLSGDEIMLNTVLAPEKITVEGAVYDNPDADIHTLSAANCTHPHLFVGVPYHQWCQIARNEALIPEKGKPRDYGKVLNFGILYLQTAKTLAENNYTQEAITKKWVEKHIETYHQFHAWKDKIAYLAEARGWIDNVDSRIRWCEETNSKGADNATSRLAVNFLVQGLGATMTKMAALKLFNLFQDTPSRILALVHDEILIEVPGQATLDPSDPTNPKKVIISDEAKEWAAKAQSCLEEAEHEVFLKYCGKDLPGKASCDIGLWWAH